MAKKNAPEIIVKKDEVNPEPLEVIAKSIIEVADACAKMNSSKLNRRAILLLLKDLTGLPMADIGKVLDAAPKLKDHYLKK